MGDITNTPASCERSLSASPRATGVENECQLEEEDSVEDEDMAELFAEEDGRRTLERLVQHVLVVLGSNRVKVTVLRARSTLTSVSLLPLWLCLAAASLLPLSQPLVAAVSSHGCFIALLA